MRSNGIWSNAGGNSVSFTTKENLYMDKEVAQLVPSDAVTNDELGMTNSISYDGTRVAFGGPLADRGGVINTGAAYVYVLDNGSWVEEGKLTPIGNVGGDYSGCSVSLSGDGTRCAVGAYNAARSGMTERGYVTIFKRTGSVWSQEATLVSSDIASLDWFGYKVSMNHLGDRCAIGGRRANRGGKTQVGVAYVFRYVSDNWIQEASLIPAVREANDAFGHSISISGDGLVVAIGATFAVRDTIKGVGLAYVFRFNGTTYLEETILRQSSPAESDEFGNAIATNQDGTIVVVGSSYATRGGIDHCGIAYVFRYNGTNHVQEAILNPKLTGAYWLFGRSVAISRVEGPNGYKILVGSSGARVNNKGAAGMTTGFRYENGDWVYEIGSNPILPLASERFGTWCSINGDGTRSAVGAQYSNRNGVTGCGSTYIFE